MADNNEFDKMKEQIRLKHTTELTSRIITLNGGANNVQAYNIALSSLAGFAIAARNEKILSGIIKAIEIIND